MNESIWGDVSVFLVAAFVCVVALLSVVIWSIRRHRDPKLHIECDLSIDKLIPSVAGLTPDPGCTAYASTKHAIVGLSRSLRVEAAHRGVRRTPTTGTHFPRAEREAALYTLLVNGSPAGLPWRLLRLPRLRLRGPSRSRCPTSAISRMSRSSSCW